MEEERERGKEEVGKGERRGGSEVESERKKEKESEGERERNILKRNTQCNKYNRQE